MANYTIVYFNTIEEMRASKHKGVYLAESLTRLTGTFDGTKVGLSFAVAGFWDRLRSMFTQSPISRVALIVCETKGETVKLETALHNALPMLTWAGRTKDSEYTTARIEAVLDILGRFPD